MPVGSEEQCRSEDASGELKKENQMQLHQRGVESRLTAALAVAMPHATAGLSAPPETAATATPPAVTHEPMARANWKFWRVRA
eukprot:CAMPEP_0168398516 /NCGR_PEP_ID=MMETSP0228-20121227/21618_1 /TAXON_ID=133427 /ORGANISM="Protoceratium reticulatum, Strain CCCM 535 (=CCMP 1889)" /LENGTH=82 /DNA_ID=CAMNT_0008412019 /DNA_START=49 /DNA_END=294 /DNA_ORIENTATION=-